MTQQDKDILIGKMLDPGATLTEAELRLILADDELREIHEVSAAVKGATVQPSTVDVDKEWRLFRHRLHPQPSRWRWAMRVAAIFLGILFVSAIVKVGIERLMTDDAPDVVAESKPSVNAGPSEPVAEPEPMPAMENEVTATKEKVSTPRKRVLKTSVPELTEEEEMEVDEYLRLQQSRIDNDLAMMQAELYVEELQALSDPDLTSSLTNSDGLSGSESRHSAETPGFSLGSADESSVASERRFVVMP